MVRRLFLTLVAGFFVVGAGTAQTAAPRFQWRAGQVLTYRVEQVTSETEVAGEMKKKMETKTKQYF